MPVSFAVLECESEGLKSPCAGGGSRPQRITRWWRPSPALPLLRQRNKTLEGNETGITRPREKRGVGTKELGLMHDARSDPLSHGGQLCT